MTAAPGEGGLAPAPRRSASGVVQVAYLVDDVRASALRHTQQFGSGPWFVGEHIPLAWVVHDGEAARFDHSSAYGQWGDVMVELVTVHTATPASLDAAVRGRGIGLHHVARLVEDLDGETDHLRASGLPQVMLAATSRGQRFAFHQAAHLGHLLEIYEPSDGLRAFYRHVARAAAHWDGSVPLRAMADATGTLTDAGRPAV